MFRGVCVLVAVLACVSAQSNETEPTVPPTYGGSSLGGDLGSLGGAVGQIQMQQAMMHHMAEVVLEWQSAQAWHSAVSLRVKLAGDDTNNNPGNFEEETPSARNLEMTGFGGMGMGYPGAYGAGFGGYGQQPQQETPSDDELELTSEKTLWYALKLMWLEASNKLNKAQANHYQNKMMMATIGAAGAQHPAISQGLMLMYYRSILDTLKSSFTIQRQDSWTTWLVYEMLETTEFEDGELSDSFSDTLKHAEHSALQTWYTETAIDVQSMFIDFYLNAIVSQMSGGAGYGSFGAGFGSLGASAASFMETESTADPSEPSKPFVGGQQMGSYMMYYIHMMKFYMRISHMNAAQSAFTAASISLSLETEEDEEKASKASEMIEPLKKATLASWSQWAQIRLMLSYYEIVSLFYGVPIPHNTHANAAAMNLVQTEDPVASTPTQEVDPVVPSLVG